MNKKKQYVTVAEFADMAKVSKQSIYQRLNNSLKDYLKVIQGKKYLNIKALHDVYGISLEQGFKDNLKDNLKVDDVEQQDPQDPIEILKKQIEKKDKQIEELHQLLSQQQALTLNLQQKIELLEEPKKGEELEEPKGIFKKLFRKGVKE